MEVISDLDCWHPRLLDPTGKRSHKPRKTGRTMVIDKGMGIRAFEDLLVSSSSHIDIIKLGFGTSALYPLPILLEKVSMAKSHQVCIIPGGTFLEVAISQKVVASFFDTVKAIGFDGIEVSDGTIEVTRQLRNELILQGLDNELTVLTEYGKKMSGTKVDIDHLVETIHLDLHLGAEMVTIEGRESGIDVGIYNENGDCNEEDIKKVISKVEDPHKLMWETPLKSQQVYFIRTLGMDTNLGNISPSDILSLESLRRGLRSDTFCTRGSEVLKP